MLKSDKNKPKSLLKSDFIHTFALVVRLKQQSKTYHKRKAVRPIAVYLLIPLQIYCFWRTPPNFIGYIK